MTAASARRSRVIRADGSCQVTAGAYPDLGRGVLMGPIARRKWRAAP